MQRIEDNLMAVLEAQSQRITGHDNRIRDLEVTTSAMAELLRKMTQVEERLFSLEGTRNKQLGVYALAATVLGPGVAVLLHFVS